MVYSVLVNRKTYKCKECKGKFYWAEFDDYVYCPYCDQLYQVIFEGEWDAYRYYLKQVKK